MITTDDRRVQKSRPTSHIEAILDFLSWEIIHIHIRISLINTIQFVVHYT